YYHDNWLGNIGSEANLRLLKKLNPNPWVAYNGTLSATNTTRNVITAAHVTSTGSMTGIEDGTLFSAVITPNGSATFCPGGSVQLDANVGAGYTYKWYKNGIEIPGATNQSYVATAAGDYTVQVTDVNATPSSVTANSVSVGVAIIAPPAALIRASGPLTFCTGGDLTLMANTGTNLWYQWQFNGNNIPGANSDTFKVTGSGNYTVTVNNIGCASTSTITTINQGPLNVMLGEDTSFCESQVLVLDAGYPGAHYLWNTGDTTQKIYITNTSADYSVFVDAGTNCQARDTINVHVDPLPSVVGISYVSMGGSTFQFAPSGQLNTNSYMWMYSDGAVDFNQNTTHTFPASADWIVTLIVFNDCGTDTSTLDLRTLDVASVKNTAGINLYPNPASDKVTLSADKVKMSEITIVNNLGQVVYRGTEENVKSTTIDITGFVDGHYIIRAKGSDGKVINKPFDVLK
ncbi:MAG: T9SS type A sorting domain-containing protein, partial [Sphingobacteriales bacterium]